MSKTSAVYLKQCRNIIERLNDQFSPKERSMDGLKVKVQMDSKH